MKYTKPPLTIDHQIDLLISRGMAIPDRDRANRYLSHISYYRLSGYWLPFQKIKTGPEHAFKDGTTFDAVIDLYVFDRKFRLLVLEAIERVEISLRANFANALGISYGSHFFLDPSYFSNNEKHEKLLEGLREEIDRSKETFIEHYRNNYDNPSFPPIWAVSEVLSFGQLSRWFNSLKSRGDRNKIASAYDMDESVLRSFMHHLTYVRNITAHHGRLWNRRMTITMSIPKRPKKLGIMLNTAADRYIANTIIMLGYLLKMISPGTTWPERIRYHVENSPNTNPAAMGFQNNWKDLPLWNSPQLHRL